MIKDDAYNGLVIPNGIENVKRILSLYDQGLPENQEVDPKDKSLDNFFKEMDENNVGPKIREFHGHSYVNDKWGEGTRFDKETISVNCINYEKGTYWLCVHDQIHQDIKKFFNLKERFFGARIIIPVDTPRKNIVIDLKEFFYKNGGDPFLRFNRSHLESYLNNISILKFGHVPLMTFGDGLQMEIWFKGYEMENRTIIGNKVTIPKQFYELNLKRNLPLSEHEYSIWVSFRLFPQKYGFPKYIDWPEVETHALALRDEFYNRLVGKRFYYQSFPPQI